ncbi:MAG: tryptophan-rich sensory protein [Candidatus Gracilibacteria bacterium]|nr:tryptophan-rich sensory protein [Candidatus Gracilibacteria bacterium]
MKNKNLLLKIFVLVAYIAMVGVNYLANALPIGGVTTGEASDSYANLFTPAGITFSIWGLIYLLLFGYTIYQFFNKDTKRNKLFASINIYFLITSLANISWIFAWHYGIIWLSVLIMLVLLIFLIKIADIINKDKYSPLDNLLIRAPFSFYFGWITVATIANISVFLVSINWNGFGISNVIWTIVVLLVGAAIGIARTLKDQNIFYGLVLVWAYAGIWLKHSSENGFAGEYPNIIAVVIGCIVLYLATLGWLAYSQIKKNNE